MRLKVTPCGARANTAAQAADAIIDYLMGRSRDPMQAAAKVLNRQGVDGTVEYYADTVEGVCVWETVKRVCACGVCACEHRNQHHSLTK